ncbi:MAG: c-type cytochrome, partial [Akkermansiaceae bacterium]
GLGMRFLSKVVFLSLMPGGVLLASPVIPGLHGKHPLDEAKTGHVLIEELRCAACHEIPVAAAMKTAPDLSEAGSRLNLDYLKQYLADPHKVHPGTTMPDVLSGLPEAEKMKVSESISHYLMSLTSSAEQSKSLVGNAKTGHEVFHEVGCVACHAPESKGPDKAKSLAHISGKYQKGALAGFLLDPLKVRSSGRMPNMNLSSLEAGALEAYFGAKTAEPSKPNAKLVELGKENFEKYNCVACHTVGGAKAAAGPKLENVDLNKGCFVGKGADYQLSNDHSKAIAAALEKPVKFSDEDRVNMKLTQLNCIACHTRDDFGGVAGEIDEFFHTTEEALGDAARIPPPLTKIGGKLKPEWMNKVLYDGLSVRPYMKTRMPQFGRRALEGLPEILAKVDKIPQVDLPPPNRQEQPMVRNGGHLLLGTEGLNCISCHNYNGKESPGMKGYDLILTYQRLQPGWFYEFMKNPAKHRPGIIMPNYWPDGKAVQTEIMGGDTHEQLRALWHQFSLGRSARDPKGLQSKPNKLEVAEKVRVYRGRSRVAGFRGLAVGYPGGLNYAFNLENGALSAIWKGEYVSANWRSQGAGDFNPSERSIQLAQDVAFLQAKDSSGKWPLKPVMTKENPVNPDPLYPKNRGYAFRGYSLSKDGNPTLRYRCGEIEIEDRFEVKSEKVLTRSFGFDTQQAGDLHFRALTGKIFRVSDGVFKTADLSLSLGSAETILRPSAVDGEQELLVKIPLAPKNNTYSIDYEILR